MREVLEEKELNVRGVPVKITIFKRKGDFIPAYFVEIPSIRRATKSILEKIKREITEEIGFSPEEMSDINLIRKLEERIKDKIKEKIEKYLLVKDEAAKNILCGYLLMETLGLGVLDVFLEDGELEEVVINNAIDPIYVFHRKWGWLKTNINIGSEEKLFHLAQEIGRRAGRQIDLLHPLLDAHLPTGDRVNATLSPISTFGNTLTIRKFRRIPFTIVDLINNGTVNTEIAAFSWLCVQYEMSTLISGGTASGKTTYLNCISCFFPPNHRIVSIEQTREINLPSFLHWVPLVTRSANPEGLGEVTMYDLMINALRMRPDRIIVGEVRRKEEAEVMFEAMRTGHSVYGTLHANTVDHFIKRMTSPPISMEPQVLEAIDAVFVLYRDRKRGIRRMLEVGELIPTERGITYNLIYRWRPATDTFTPMAESKRLFPELELFTGMTPKEIVDDIKEKMQVLDWMRKWNVNTVDDIGKIVAVYYTDREYLLDLVWKDKNPFEEVL